MDIGPTNDLSVRFFQSRLGVWLPFSYYSVHSLTTELFSSVSSGRRDAVGC